ncbi:hypothetical protein [Paenibacillus sp. NEAU-GSW1]|uniref:hypothetical protein n=1 Tax=Paenibacillus sp. NEAU-GSW1 TaxID=2682486 RepID=UPI0012E1E9F4|nr:hypothetical protein [Paenibacillus sp. NEAU-GSW1]MUT64923.1 hypothetical protein [Paenibacillus sp. NEAU-GSW1]
MIINLKEPFACELLLTSVVNKLYPKDSFDISKGGEATLLTAGDEISEEHLGGDGSFEHFNIKHDQLLFTYGYDLPEVDLQAFLIANAEMNEVYCICLLDSDGNVFRAIRDFNFGPA